MKTETATYPTTDVEKQIIEDAASGLTVVEPIPDTNEQVINGVIVTRVLVMKRLADADWILKNVIVHGKGSKASVARIIGQCTGVEHKSNVYQDKQLKSIMMSGVFEAQSYTTGEIIKATNVYLPMAFAEQIAVLFADETTKIVELDLDIGVAATGKSIPYEWTCTSFLETGGSVALTRLRNRRQPRAMLSLIGGEETKQIA